MLLSGCSANRYVETENLLSEGEIGTNKIAIVPFTKVIAKDPNAKFAQCPIGGVFLRTCGFSGNPEKAIRKLFFNKLKSRKKYELVPPDKVEGVYERISAASFETDQREILKRVGEELGADWVVAGYLYCYSERKGYVYSAEQPASVAFSLHLLRVSDKLVVWKSVFDKTQSSLMENILNISSFFKEGVKWVTAEELSKEGIDEIAKTFPGFEDR